MAPKDELARRCPECGAAVDGREERCWLCRRPLGDEAPVMAQLVAGPLAAHRSPTSGFQFSLESLLLIVTLSAVCLGALVSVPGLGVLALMIAVPALVRTCVSGIAAKPYRGRASATDKVMAFLASAAITWAAFMAAGIAFFGACSVSLLGGAAVGQIGGFRGAGGQEFFIWSAVALCSVMSIAAFVAMFWLTWPRAGR